MPNVVLMMTVSVDGFFEGPGADLSWHRVDDELHDHFNEVLAACSMFLDGRVTYELMARFWPTADQDPASDRPMREFAAIWRDKPKIVYSTTLQTAGWNTTIVPEVDPAAVAALKAGPGGDLALGGGALADEFRRHDLIDEYRFYVQPVLLGRGTPLFRPMRPEHPLRLRDTRTFGNGVTLLHYERLRSSGSAG